MPKRHDGLFDRIANFDALIRAARRAIKGKRRKPSGAASAHTLNENTVSRPIAQARLPNTKQPLRRLIPHLPWL